jgi:hypothetical protein
MVLTWVDDGGADELAGDALAEELVDDGGAEVVEVEHVLAHDHLGALEPRMLVQPRQVADDPAQHLRFADTLSSIPLCFRSGVVWMMVPVAPWWQGIYSEARRGGRGITGPVDVCVNGVPGVCVCLRSARSISIPSLCRLAASPLATGPAPRRTETSTSMWPRLVLIVVYETYGTGRIAATHRGPAAAPSSTGDE